MRAESTGLGELLQAEVAEDSLGVVLRGCPRRLRPPCVDHRKDHDDHAEHQGHPRALIGADGDKCSSERR